MTTLTNLWTKLMDRPRGIFAGLAALLAAPLIGCTASLHPVSTAQEARADRALFGVWHSRISDEEHVDEEHIFAIGRPPRHPELTGGVDLPDGLLNVVMVSFNDPQNAHEVEVMYIPAIATVFGEDAGTAASEGGDVALGHWGVLSIPVFENDGTMYTPAHWQTENAESWILLHYRIVGDTLHVSPLSEEKVRTTIAAGKLAGRMGKGDGKKEDGKKEADEPNMTSVADVLRASLAHPSFITASTDDLRTFLAGGGDLFDSNMLVLHRVAPVRSEEP